MKKEDFEFAVYIIGILFGAFIVSELLRWIIKRTANINAKKLKVDPTHYSFLKNTISFVIYSIALALIIYSVPGLKALGATLFAGAGIFAAIGLAVGALGTALAAMMSGFLALIWWQMPIAILGLLLIISGPSMVLAWFKLRQRNLSPLLDANGWAVNTNAKVSIAFGATLTVLASLPKGAKRELKDPFA